MKGLGMHGFVLAACLLTCVQSWKLMASRDRVVPGFTRDLTLKCFNNGSHNGSVGIQRLNRIRIQKLGSDNKWTTIALKGIGHSPVSATGVGVTTTGLIDKLNNSFLSVTWSQTFQETVGLYKCQVVGIDPNFIFVSIPNLIVNITATPVSVNDVVGVVLSNEKRSNERQNLIQTMQERLNETQTELRDSRKALKADHQKDFSSLTKLFHGFENETQKELRGARKALEADHQKDFSSLTKLFHGFENETQKELHEVRIALKADHQRDILNLTKLLNNLENETTETMKKTRAEFKSELKHFNSMFDEKLLNLKTSIAQGLDSKIQSKIDENDPLRTWPREAAAFLAPQSGCSHDPAWAAGTATIDRTYGWFYPVFSGGNHLLKPLSSGPGNIQMRFCKKASSRGRINWPKGTYCFLKAEEGSCPSGFYIILWRLTSTNGYYAYNFRTTIDVKGPPFDLRYNQIDISICCREDGSASVPISLPTERPFYMIRHLGPCQAVRDANAAEESLTIGSVHNYLTVHYNKLDGNGKPYIVSANNAGLGLCYYTHRS